MKRVNEYKREGDEVKNETVCIEDSCLAYGSIKSSREGLYSKYRELSSRVPTPGNPSGDPCTTPMIPMQPALYSPTPTGHMCESSNRAHNQVYPFLHCDL